MLKHISIRNIALIERLEMDFSPGLNILTGETGAGKSIIIDALNLVLGRRADKELIKTGTQKAAVEAEFSMAEDISRILQQLGIEPEQDLTLSRELNISGRNTCRINGTLVNNAALQRLAGLLVDIHGQHENQSLFDKESHLRILDEYSGADVAKAKAEAAQLYKQLRSVEKQLRQLSGGDEGERERRIDLLRFQYDEISAAELQPGEDERLTTERNRLANAERIMLGLNSAYSCIYGQDSGGAMPWLSQAATAIRDIAELDKEYAETAERIDDLYYSAEAVSEQLRGLSADFYYDPAELENIERRLDVIKHMARKYGGSLEAALQYMADSATELERLENAGAELQRLSDEKAGILGELYQACVVLSDLRRHASQRFSQEVCAELNELGMKASFTVQFGDILPLEQMDAASFSMDGLDKPEFMFSANPGEPVKPLSRIASGGEASRIMLALKSISARLDNIDCLVFDEIDTGISGRVASVVGRKMAGISRIRQVLCITHLAQIASMADANYLIEKRETEGRTYTTIQLLDAEGKRMEVSRLLGGEGDSGHGLAHARELIQQADRFKSES